MNASAPVRRAPLRARLLRVGFVVVAAGGLLGAGSGRATGQTSALGGYQGIAQADGVHVFYNPEGLLPVNAPVDLGSPDAFVTISSGPATYARAGVADPGDLLANPDALLQQGVSGWKPGTIPAYPFRITASSGAGEPTAESNPAPGLNAKVSADGKGSVATATMPAVNVPAVVTVGSARSVATSTTDGATVTVHGHTEISDITILSVVHIGSVVTDLTATSDGTTTSVSGGTVVTDGTVGGMPVTIDAGGVTPAPASSTPPTNPISALLTSIAKPALGNLNDVLAAAGIHLTVAAPIQQGNAKAGQLTSAGLEISLELSQQTFPALKSILDALPYVPPLAPGTPSLSDVVQLARARHLVAVDVARGQVSLSARASQPITAAVPAPAGFATGAGASATPSATSRPSSAAPAPSSAAPLVSAPVAVAAPAAAPGLPAGVGVGAFALLALLVQPFFGDRMARFANAILAPDATAACPRGEP